MKNTQIWLIQSSSVLLACQKPASIRGFSTRVYYTNNRSIASLWIATRRRAAARAGIVLRLWLLQFLKIKLQGAWIISHRNIVGPPIKQGANEPGPPNLHNAKRNFQKNVAPDCKITNFDQQPQLFNGASMEAITLGFSKVRQLNSPVLTAR